MRFSSISLGSWSWYRDSRYSGHDSARIVACESDEASVMRPCFEPGAIGDSQHAPRIHYSHRWVDGIGGVDSDHVIWVVAVIHIIGQGQYQDRSVQKLLLCFCNLLVSFLFLLSLKSDDLVAFVARYRSTCGCLRRVNRNSISLL